MSPSHSCLSPPALSDDDIVSVFLRIPPDEPARLFRASLVCKAWRRILTCPDFCRLYREFHRTPPMLGFALSSWSGSKHYDSRFVPTTAFRLSEDLHFDPQNWRAVDSRHGRILLELGRDDEVPSRYIVCDPITSGGWGVPDRRIDGLSSTAAVLCAKEHCDHLGCHGHPFLVAIVVTSASTTSACVYSSESGVWSDTITLKHKLKHGDFIDYDGRSILVGNRLHFPFAQSYSVLQYKLGEQKLSVIDVPHKNWAHELHVFISVEDDVLVFAGWKGTSLSLWSSKAGALAWTQRVVIDLEKLIPPRAFEHKIEDHAEFEPYVSAFAEGDVFLSTMAGLFTVELISGRTKKSRLYLDLLSWQLLTSILAMKNMPLLT